MNLNTKINDPELDLKTAVVLWAGSIVVQFTTILFFLNEFSLTQILHGIMQMLSPFVGMYASVYLGIRLIELLLKKNLEKHSKKWWFVAIVSFIVIEIFIRNPLGSFISQAV